MKQRQSKLLVLVMMVGLLLSCYLVQASEGLDHQYTDQLQLQSETLEMPYLTAQASPLALEAEKSLFDIPSEMRFQGDFKYEKISTGFRIELNAPKDSSLSWNFEQSINARNRWFRIRYSGLTEPKKVGLQIEKAGQNHESAVFDLHLMDSPAPEEVYFKIPDHEEFDGVNILRLIFDSEQDTEENLEFLILNLDLLPQGSDPLKHEASDGLRA